MKKKRVVVGLSGGVDSAVTAKILVDQGHEVIGVFMKNWDDVDDPHCPAAVDAIDARNVAAKLGIPFYVVNFTKQYWDNVFEYFLEQHRKFRTPNPDILCNKYIKFARFSRHAEKLGADFVATGHYARNVFNDRTQKFELQTPYDADKDQTYFLYTLQQAQLHKTLFPLADFPKSEIRKMAKEFGFENATKKDSTGICFVGERDYMTFLKKYLHQEPGDIVTEDRMVIGQHIGLSFYTLGQRKNLNVGGVRGYEEAPWFVLSKDIEKNQIVACQDDNNPKLFSRSLVADKLDWVAGVSPLEDARRSTSKVSNKYSEVDLERPCARRSTSKISNKYSEVDLERPCARRSTSKVSNKYSEVDLERPCARRSTSKVSNKYSEVDLERPWVKLLCKVRYRQDYQKCTIALSENQTAIEVKFKEPQRAVTPGQAIVFYSLDGKVCLGGGEIQ